MNTVNIYVGKTYRLIFEYIYTGNIVADSNGVLSADSVYSDLVELLQGKKFYLILVSSDSNEHLYQVVSTCITRLLKGNFLYSDKIVRTSNSKYLNSVCSSHSVISVAVALSKISIFEKYSEGYESRILSVGNLVGYYLECEKV